MGWFDGLFGSSDSAGRASDPLAKLDPKLRQFLEKESPLKYQPAPHKESGEDASHPQDSQQQSAAPSADSPVVPTQSLYQDGRYAHLWKTYRPLAEVEAETKTDHERLMDVLDALQDRRAQIGRAALENCAVEQVDWNTCIRTGSLTSRMTLCHAEMQKFERCYNMQSRLLKALGYLSTYERPPEDDERIQMHADALYHRMLDQEAAIELAKAEGRPVPAISMDIGVPALSSPAGSSTTPSAPTAAEMTERLADIPEDLRKDWAERLVKLPENERVAEEAALRAELQARSEIAGRVAKLRAAQAAEREQRKAEGRATLRDRVSGLLSVNSGQGTETKSQEEKK